jgi:hypothetical protein
MAIFEKEHEYIRQALIGVIMSAWFALGAHSALAQPIR